MSFIWPFMLFNLLFVPVLVGIYFRLLQRRRQLATNLGPLGVLKNDSGREIGVRRHMAPIFYLFSLTLLIFGLARPEMIVSLPRTEGTVILAFDVSNSMMADDLEPTRIDAAKVAAQAFIENQPRTIQVGVVAFSNGGLVVQQPTISQEEILSAIDRLNPQGGTSLGQGIFASINAIAGEAIAIDETLLEQGTQTIDVGYYPSAVVLLLTDGENTGPPEPLEIAQVAAEAGVRIYAVGIGSPEGAVLEIDGFNVVTQLNEGTLQDIANLTNGRYYHAEDEDALQEIYKTVDLQMTIKGEKSEITSILAAISLLSFLIGGAFSLIWFGRLP
jgi:Ca-activated chloride channel family protein